MSVQEDLQILREARYGKDVRNALIDAITDIDGVAQTAMSYAAGARDSAQSYANEAKAWADGEGAESSDPQYHNNAKYYSEEADRLGGLQADQAEAWATGKIDGTDVPSTATQYHNNAKYFSEEASRLGAAQVALAAAEVDQAEAWATGQIDGTDVPSTDPQYHNNAKYYSQQVQNESENAEAWAAGTRGGTAVPSTDPAYENNAAYYKDLANYWYLQAKAIAEGFAGALIPMGTVAFANLPALADVSSGAMYNISDSFTTTSDFEEGAGHVIPVGANIYKTNNGKWDVLAGSPVSGVKGDKEVNYRQGNVNITPANVGAVAYFNDTDYQPVNQLAYNPTTKKLGLKVNGADTVIPFSSGAELYYNNILQAKTSLKKVKLSNKLINFNPFRSVSTLPYAANASRAVVLNGEIHILGGSASGNRKKHYKWDGSSWTSVSTLPYDFANASAVVLDGEIHILGSSTAGSNNETKHYKWDGISWTSVSTLPYDFKSGAAVVLSGEIHILGSSSTNKSKMHYKWDGTSWTSVSTLPYDFYSGNNAVVLNGEIHILGGGILGTYTNHYKWNGSTWTSVSTLPYKFYSGNTVVLNGEIHILGGTASGTTKKEHYKWNGTKWIAEHIISYDFYNAGAVVLDGEIHLLGSGNSSFNTLHFKQAKRPYHTSDQAEPIPTTNLPSPGASSFGAVMLDNSSIVAIFDATCYYLSGSSNGWVQGTTVPYSFSAGAMVHIKNGSDDEIHIFGGNAATNQVKHYKANVFDLFYNSGSWTEVSTLPYNFRYGAAVVLNDEIHILGSDITGNGTKHYKWNGSAWTSVSTLPYSFYYTSAVVLNGEIHLLGGGDSTTSRKRHYKWDGTNWTSVSTLPYAFHHVGGNGAIVYEGRIHIFGGTTSGNEKLHYSWDGYEWTKENNLNRNFSSGCAVAPEEFFINETGYPYEYIPCIGPVHLLGGTGTLTRHTAIGLQPGYIVESQADEVDTE